MIYITPITTTTGTERILRLPADAQGPRQAITVTPENSRMVAEISAQAKQQGLQGQALVTLLTQAGISVYDASSL